MAVFLVVSLVVSPPLLAFSGEVGIFSLYVYTVVVDSKFLVDTITVG